MEIYGRQGDLVIEKTQITGELKPCRNLVLAGSDNGAHVLNGACLHRQVGRRHEVRIAEATTLSHGSRHNTAAMEPGDYVIGPLRERGDGQDRDVED